MWFFCTGGKGTENFIADELKEKLSVTRVSEAGMVGDNINFRYHPG